MPLNAQFGFVEILKQLAENKTAADFHLRGGQSLSGKVLEVGDHFVVLGHLKGKDFFDAQVRIDDISAIETQTRGK
jgi:hypothetical protein